jgi:hypothetical protein
MKAPDRANELPATLGASGRVEAGNAAAHRPSPSSIVNAMKISRTAAVAVACSLGAGCVRTPSAEMQAANEPRPVVYAARDYSGHTDGRTYGGVVNAPHDLSGRLGSYRGCLVETRTRTLIVLSGAMEFHRADTHSERDHVFSKSIAGDRPAVTIPVGAPFAVSGMRTRQPLENIRLETAVPAHCTKLPIFLTSSETFKAR